MRIESRDLRSFRYPGPTVLTIGNFDGVHLGHQAILRTLRAEASSHSPDAKTALLTFDPHPAAVLRPDLPLRLLTTPRERLQLIERFGLDLGIIQPFDLEFASQPPARFLALLVERLGLARLVVGPDFALGRGRSGTVEVLKALGAQLGYELSVIEPVAGQAGEIRSRQLRNCLLAGKVREAAQMLGRRYNIVGLVEQGDRRGREIGVPTANVQPPPQRLTPADGVYATWTCLLDGSSPVPMASVTNVGTRPTIGGGKRRIETHLLDFRPQGASGELYGRKLSVAFVQRLRDELRFGSVEALVGQIRQDIDAARRALKAQPPMPDCTFGIQKSNQAQRNPVWE